MFKCESCTLVWIAAASVVSVVDIDSCWPEEINAQPTTRPTMNTTEATMISVDRCAPTSISANNEIADFQSWRGNRTQEGHIVSDHFDTLEHFAKVTCNCNLLDWMDKFP